MGNILNGFVSEVKFNIVGSMLGVAVGNIVGDPVGDEDGLEVGSKVGGLSSRTSRNILWYERTPTLPTVTPTPVGDLSSVNALSNKSSV